MRKAAAVLIFLLLCVPYNVFGADVSGPDVQLRNNEIFVTTGLVLDDENLQNIKKGISKEIVFYIDLFRVWKTWPDEFVAGKKIVKTLESDYIKKEYTATSFDGTARIKKRFKDIDSMLAWALNISDFKLFNARDLEAANYFVRVIAESRLRNLPPVVGYLLFFVPEKDFKLTKDSPAFHAGAAR